MALVRCSCLVELHGAAWDALDVQVLDPDCGYVMHRLEAELLAGEAPAA